MDAPPPCSDGNTKAITAEDTVRENPVIRDGGVPSSPTSTLPATEQWVGELLHLFAVLGDHALEQFTGVDPVVVWLVLLQPP